MRRSTFSGKSSAMLRLTAPPRIAGQVRLAGPKRVDEASYDLGVVAPQQLADPELGGLTVAPQVDGNHPATKRLKISGADISLLQSWLALVRGRPKAVSDQTGAPRHCNPRA
jgi:hypothetical protein